MKNKTVTGVYSENAYEIFVDGQWVYSARNHALDSMICVPSGSGEAARTLKLPVADPLKEAKAILTEALCHNPQHDDACEARRFAEHNSYLPASHPAWNSQPACTCWVGRLAGWLNNNLES